MENLNNLPPFYTGQKVVYITGYFLPKDSIHVIKNILKFPCGCVGVDVGIHLENKSNKTQCIHHGMNGVVYSGSSRVFMSTSFRPLQESPFPSLTYSKVLEKESELISLN